LPWNRRLTTKPSVKSAQISQSFLGTKYLLQDLRREIKSEKTTLELTQKSRQRIVHLSHMENVWKDNEKDNRAIRNDYTFELKQI